MSRPRKITPYRPSKKGNWMARFYDCDDKRKNGSLRTKDHFEARLICVDLERLSVLNLKMTDKRASELSKIAYDLYFDTDRPARLDQLPDFSACSKTAFYDMCLMQEKIDSMTKRLVELEEYKMRYDGLMQEAEYRRIEKERVAPLFEDVAELYKEDVKHLSGKGALHNRMLIEFMDFLDCRLIKVSAVTPADVSRYLSHVSEGHQDPCEFHNRRRRDLHRFWKWLSVTYQIDNIIAKIATKKEKAKGDIIWHSAEEINKVLEGLNPFWQAVVATMAFSGLSAHELRGIKLTEYIDGNSGKMWRIKPTEERSTKSLNRIRNVAIHKKRLQPILDKYISEREGDTEYFFPCLLAGRKADLWNTVSFSIHLNKRLPDGMNALSLRRTFGSLLIRAGKSEEEVAAAMGNTPDMVRKHYGRILGSEVDIDF